MNVTQNTIDALYELITEAFKMNRWLDRWVSVLGVKFAMNNTAQLCHKVGFAHYYPTLSDAIGDSCLERYNVDVQYGATPEGKEDYNDPKSMIIQLRDKVLEFQTLYMGAMKIAFENNDFHVYTALSEQMEDLSLRSEEAILMVDKLSIYNDMGSYDAHIKDYFWVTPIPDEDDD